MTLNELIKEYEESESLWSMYGCDCLGNYMNAVQQEIENLRKNN